MRKLLPALTLIIAFAFSIVGQTTSGKIIGTVSDASGAIAGATVTVTDNQTGRQQTAVTSGDGTYTIPQLEFGTYTVRITANAIASMALFTVLPLGIR